jgi:hypothetical protein
MSKSQNNPAEDLELEEYLTELDEIAEDDYIFVITSQGEMKTVIFPPRDEFEYSKKLLRLFKLLGCGNPDDLHTQRILH